jgi:hypothetical protein
MPRTLKRHDTADPISGTAFDTDPTTGAKRRADLTVFQTITFQMKLPAVSEVVEGVAECVETVDGPGALQPDGLPLNRGKWRYAQVDADVDTLGGFKVELECELANGKKVHFPSKEADNETITVEADLDNA